MTVRYGHMLAAAVDVVKAGTYAQAQMALSKAQAKRDERRNLILDVARDCFLAEGYAAASMSSIAARLGGSKGTLYNYFKSKEELFAAVMQRQCELIAEQLFDQAHEGDGPRERLSHFGRTFLTMLLSPESLGIQRLVVAESGRFPELGMTFYAAGPRTVQLHVAGYLRRLMDEGILRRADPEIAALHFKDLALSGVYQVRLWGVIGDPTPEEIDERIDRAVDTFLRAYRPD